MPLRSVLLAALAGIVFTLAVSAQNLPPDKKARPLAYDIISIKINKSGSGQWHLNTSGASFTAQNITLKELLQFVYETKEYLISGISGPIDSMHFDIKAKVLDLNGQPKPTDKQLTQMMQPVLAERFHLQLHKATRTVPLYELMLMPGGPKLKKAEDQLNGNMNMKFQDTAYEFDVHGMSLQSFADTLADQIHRPVTDKTGLADHYDFTLKWTSNDSGSAPTDAAPKHLYRRTGAARS